MFGKLSSKAPPAEAAWCFSRYKPHFPYRSIRLIGSKQAQQQTQKQPQASGGKPNILVIFGDDTANRMLAPTGWGYGVSDAQHRPPRPRRHDLYRLLRRAELHGGALDFHHRSGDLTHRTFQGWHSRRARWACRRGTLIAQAPKPLGCARASSASPLLTNEYLPTVHGFDEFFGNLYHLNAEEEPELFNYPRDPQIPGHFGPRGVLRRKGRT